MTIETDPRPLILFHSNCMDGLTAAWIAWRHHLDGADYVPVRYGAPAPDCTDRLVYILDFCYPPEETVRIADQATRVIILDHHKTAIDRFNAGWTERPDVECHFDLERSGAGMASDYFTSAARVWPVDFVEDRDLWRWRLPHSEEINACLAANCMGVGTMAGFEALNELRGRSAKQIISQGEGALLQIQATVRQLVRLATPTAFAGFDAIPFVNMAPPMASEVLNELAYNAPFAVSWCVEGQKATFSLRSTGEDAFDCAKLAETFGGGGHRRAAGFARPVSELFAILSGTT